MHLTQRFAMAMVLALTAASAGRAQGPFTRNLRQGWIGGIAFSPDGKLLLSGSDDATLRLWSVAP